MKAPASDARAEQEVGEAIAITDLDEGPWLDAQGVPVDLGGERSR